MEIKDMAMELKLSYIRENSREAIQEAQHLSLTHEAFLTMILEREILKRKDNGISRRIRNGKFINRKFIEDFDKGKYSTELIVNLNILKH